MRITKKHENRPCDIKLKSGITAHGKIGLVKNGIIKLVDIYVPGLIGPENGQFTSYHEYQEAKQILTIY